MLKKIRPSPPPRRLHYLLQLLVLMYHHGLALLPASGCRPFVSEFDVGRPGRQRFTGRPALQLFRAPHTPGAALLPHGDVWVGILACCRCCLGVLPCQGCCCSSHVVRTCIAVPLLCSSSLLRIVCEKLVVGLLQQWRHVRTCAAAVITCLGLHCENAGLSQLLACCCI